MHTNTAAHTLEKKQNESTASPERHVQNHDNATDSSIQSTPHAHHQANKTKMPAKFMKNCIFGAGFFQTQFGHVSFT